MNQERYQLFSLRNKDTTSDFFEYDFFPPTFRNQFIHIVSTAFDQVAQNNMQVSVESLWDATCTQFCYERGLKELVCWNDRNNRRAFESYVDDCTDTDFLDLMDFVFSNVINNDYIKKICPPFNKDFNIVANNELNWRLKQHNLGYEFVNGLIIKKTNTVTHEKIVKPALCLLYNDSDFSGPEEEYTQAWKHFQDGDNKSAVMNAGKAFESVMKTICEKLSYPYDKDRDDAKRLINILMQNGFIPKYLESHMNGIRATLESGAPVVRNKTSGHGQGSEIVTLPDSFAIYTLNLVATNIVFLYTLYQEHRGNNHE